MIYGKGYQPDTDSLDSLFTTTLIAGSILALAGWKAYDLIVAYVGWPTFVLYAWFALLLIGFANALHIFKK